MITRAYGSITIVDIGDLGTLSVYPESNSHTSVVYDPNVSTGSRYNPDWTETGKELILSPVIHYGGQDLPDGAKKTITWKYRIGTGQDITIGTSDAPMAAANVRGEKVGSDGCLVVNQNVLNTTDTALTYICYVDYTEPQTQTILSASG
jgi:hypothetical protein